MPKMSAGILLYRYFNDQLELLLVHPGGPFWANKDPGSWSIPKGLVEENENHLDAAKREFKEETGFEIGGYFKDLGELRQSNSKIVHAFAQERDLDVSEIESNTFTIDWGGKEREYPEIDRAKWFSVDEAREKILKGQKDFIDKLLKTLNNSG